MVPKPYNPPITPNALPAALTIDLVPRLLISPTVYFITLSGSTAFGPATACFNVFVSAACVPKLTTPVGTFLIFCNTCIGNYIDCIAVLKALGYIFLLAAFIVGSKFSPCSLLVYGKPIP